jgi:hypothetical protein
VTLGTGNNDRDLILPAGKWDDHSRHRKKHRQHCIVRWRVQARDQWRERKGDRLRKDASSD